VAWIGLYGLDGLDWIGVVDECITRPIEEGRESAVSQPWIHPIRGRGQGMAEEGHGSRHHIYIYIYIYI